MNKNIFNTQLNNVLPADTVNDAGGVAYNMSSAAALAQYAVTGTFNTTYYVNDKQHLQRVQKLAQECSSEFLAKLAVYARQEAKMKDMPAYLLAVLAARNEHKLLRKIFDRVCDNSKMLFGFVSIIRSGVTGRRSFGTAIKKMIQSWLTQQHNWSLYLSSVGHSNPSMADVIKMVHPKPTNEYQAAMFSYILGKECDISKLPLAVRQLIVCNGNFEGDIPDVPFRVLTNYDLSKVHWQRIATRMPWNTLRQSLVLLGRRGVFDSQDTVEKIAQRLSNKNEVLQNNVFPFELLATWKATKDCIPIEITNALYDAMDIATHKAPQFNGKTLVAIDTSGSMQWASLTGASNKPSIISVVEAAALIACSILRKNKTTKLIGFDCAQAFNCYTSNGIYVMDDIRAHDSVFTNMSKMYFNGGGTDCSLPFKYLLSENLRVDNIIVLSDNQSWSGTYGPGSASCNAWTQYKKSNPKTRLMCVDLTPNQTTQVPDNKDVINIGGWSDSMYGVMSQFFNEHTVVNFVQTINNTEI
jgi:60 kDa SS-A/Ro ribonucleoprotein